MWLVESPWGDAKVDVPHNDLEELKDLNSHLEPAYRRRNARGVQAWSRRLGSALFDALFRGDIRRKYDRTFGAVDEGNAVLPMLLRVGPSEWSDLLLEVIWDCGLPYHGDQFLCRGRKTVLSRYPPYLPPDKGPVHIQEVRISKQIRMPAER